MSSDAVLVFLLDGPLQSWGTSSRFQRRNTDSFPSKSGVLGLVAAAMGIDKYQPDEPERLQPLAALHFSVYRVPRLLNGKPASVLRLTDYHTVGGGYDEENDAWARLSTPRKASGGPFGTVLTQRDYLTDALFAVALKGSRPLLESINLRLADPVWGVWLGRKCCVPSTPVLGCLGKDSTTALEKLLRLAQSSFGEKSGCSYGPPTLASHDLDEAEPAAPQDGADTRADQPLSYGQRRHATRTLRT